MSLPTLAKTWQLVPNTTITVQANLEATDDTLFLAIKNTLKGFASSPWTVVGSSDSSTAGLDGVDRWSNIATLVHAVAGSAHSWIVLKQAGVLTNFQLCIDVSNAVSNAATVVVSPSAGFTGGSTTARPTATDERILINNASFLPGSNTQLQLHIWQSTDGACTRIVVYSANTLQTVWCFDKANNPVSGWTYPFVARATTAAADWTYASLNAQNFSSRGSANFGCGLSGEGAGTIFANTTDVGSVLNSFSNEWPLFPMGVYSTATSHKGRHGTIYDMWWRPNGITTADTLPNNASTRQFVVLGDTVLPWTGDSTVMLTT